MYEGSLNIHCILARGSNAGGVYLIHSLEGLFSKNSIDPYLILE